MDLQGYAKGAISSDHLADGGSSSVFAACGFQDSGCFSPAVQDSGVCV